MRNFIFTMTVDKNGYSNPYYFIDGKRVPEWVYHDRSRRCVRFDCFHTQQLKNGRYRHTSFGYQE